MDSAFVPPLGGRLCLRVRRAAALDAPPRRAPRVCAPRAVMSEQHAASASASAASAAAASAAASAAAAPPSAAVADGAARVQVSAEPHADVSLSAFQRMEDVDELLALADEFDVNDLRVVDHGVCVEITRARGMGFEDGKLVSVPAATAAAAGDGVVVLDDGALQAGDGALQVGAEHGAVPADADGAAAAMQRGARQEEVREEKDPDTVYDSDFVVTSNRVGWFFSGAKNKPPLANVGDHVDFNQPVCIIEQLGQQYVYLSEASGTVLKIFVEDGDAVEYGQHIMVIRPD